MKCKGNPYVMAVATMRVTVRVSQARLCLSYKSPKVFNGSSRRLLGRQFPVASCMFTSLFTLGPNPITSQAGLSMANSAVKFTSSRSFFRAYQWLFVTSSWCFSTAQQEMEPVATMLLDVSGIPQSACECIIGVASLTEGLQVCVFCRETCVSWPTTIPTF